jgi:hypothetical protein
MKISTKGEHTMNPTGEFEFTVDESYENEKGQFKVISIDRDDMVIRWKNGEEVSTSIEFQGRIQGRRQWEQKKQEELAAAAKPAPAKPKPAAKKKTKPPAE